MDFFADRNAAHLSLLSNEQKMRHLSAANKKIEHLTVVLRESEATSLRLTEQAKLLKEEIRRFESIVCHSIF